MRLAGKVQSLLLPKEYPPADHIAFASHYTAAQKIGGDLYDVFSIDDKTIAFAIADVSGKGISAALLMAICQTHLHHFAKAYRSPAKVLSAINEAMERKMQRDMFITMIYAVLDLETERLELARAGHELPFFYNSHSNGTVDVRPVQSPGMAIGMVEPKIFDSVIQDTSIHFGSEDVLLFYTDGITEAFAPVDAAGRREMFGLERLDACLNAASAAKPGGQPAGASPSALIDAIHAALLKHVGSMTRDDDQTLVLVRRRAD